MSTQEENRTNKLYKAQDGQDMEPEGRLLEQIVANSQQTLWMGAARKKPEHSHQQGLKSDVFRVDTVVRAPCRTSWLRMALEVDELGQGALKGNG